MKKLMAGLLALLLLPWLSGCSAMLTREYRSVTPHADVPPPAEADFTLEADTYERLVNCVLYFVNRHMATGTIRFSNYDGDIGEAVQTACLEVMRNDPLGAFVVDYITSDVVRIVSYYEAELTITYKHSQSDVKNMIPVAGTLSMKREIGSLLEVFSERAVIYNTGFSGDENSVRDLVREAYYENPASAMGLPDISVKLYPEEGVVRVVELKLQYPLSREDLLQRENAVLDAAYRIAERYSGQPDAEKAALFCNALQEMAQTRGPADGGVPSGTAWDVLVGQTGDSEGFALALRLLCDQAGMDCLVVRGSLVGAMHDWNIITMGDRSYHIDPSSNDAKNRFSSDAVFLKLGYSWTAETYPACDTSLSAPRP